MPARRSEGRIRLIEADLPPLRKCSDITLVAFSDRLQDRNEIPGRESLCHGKDDDECDHANEQRMLDRRSPRVIAAQTSE